MGIMEATEFWERLRRRSFAIPRPPKLKTMPMHGSEFIIYYQLHVYCFDPHHLSHYLSFWFLYRPHPPPSPTQVNIRVFILVNICAFQILYNNYSFLHVNHYHFNYEIFFQHVLRTLLKRSTPTPPPHLHPSRPDPTTEHYHCCSAVFFLNCKTPTTWLSRELLNPYHNLPRPETPTGRKW